MRWMNFETLQDAGAFVWSALRLNLALVVTCAPLWALLLGVVDPASSVLGLPIAIALSGPGIAAAFAAFRDAPGFAFGEAKRERLAGGGERDRPAYLAAPYWRPAEGGRLLRPYARAYAVLLRRSLGYSLGFGAAVAIGLVDLQLLRAFSWGAMAAIPVAVALALAVIVYLASLVLVVEYPKAKVRTTLWNAAFLGMKRWFASALVLVAVAVGASGVAMQPVLVLMLAISLVAYLVWGTTRWIVMPLIDALDPDADTDADAPRRAHAPLTMKALTEFRS